MQNYYHVDYKDERGVEWTEKILAASAGRAFAMCQEKFPEATMIRATCSGKYKDGYGHTTYNPPVVQRQPKKEPRPYKAVQSETFPFFAEVPINKERRHEA